MLYITVGNLKLNHHLMLINIGETGP